MAGGTLAREGGTGPEITMDLCLPFDAQTPMCKAPNHLAIEVDGDVMLMSESLERYLGLDDIGSDIWRRLERPQTVTELCAGLAQDYDGERETIERDVAGLLTALHGYGLLKT